MSRTSQSNERTPSEECKRGIKMLLLFLLVNSDSPIDLRTSALPKTASMMKRASKRTAHIVRTRLSFTKPRRRVGWSPAQSCMQFLQSEGMPSANVWKTRVELVMSSVILCRSSTFISHSAVYHNNSCCIGAETRLETT